MNKEVKPIEPYNIVKAAYDAASDRKAIEPVVVDISHLSTVADYFLICGADNLVQLRGICNEILDRLYEMKRKPKHMEGYNESSGWVLIDYGSVIVHVFLQEVRVFYALEDLWGDAKRIRFDE